MTKPVTIPCHSCNGKGQRTLPAKYTAAFDTLKKLKRATCQRVHEAMLKDGTADDSAKSLNLIYKQMGRMAAWGAVAKVKRIKPVDGDLRKAAWEFRVV